ncbi:MAG: Na/Pi cotransporter family protein [Rhodospirillaceae bacterium]
MSLDWLGIASGLLGGLALFLYGLDKAAAALKAVVGEKMQPMLASLTRNRWAGAATGATVTAVINSSTVTTVLVVGLISAEVMTLTQAIPIIFGANIGSTFTAQIIAFKFTAIGLPMVAAGFGAMLLAKQDAVRHWGAMFMGLGLVLFGMTLMGDSMAPMRDYPPFINLMLSLSNPLLGILVGALLTAVIQSSAAATGVVIVMASQGLISLDAGIAVVFGSNIGTCSTALLAAIGKSRDAVRAALVHVLFNVFGVILWMAFIPQLADLVVLISPSSPELVGAERLAAEVPRQVANAHTLFNVINTFLFIGFVDSMARLVVRLVPDRPVVLPPAAQPQYLAFELISTPSLALDAVQREIEHMGKLVDGMMAVIMPAALKGTPSELYRIAEMDADVDALHSAIVEYMRQVGRGTLSKPQSERYVRLMEVANSLEQVGDIIETELVQTGLRRVEGGVQVSAPTQQLLLDLHERAREGLSMAVEAVVEHDVAKATRVVAMKSGIGALAHQAVEHGAKRLVSDAPNRMRAYTREMEVIEKLRRVYYFSKRMAQTVLAPQDTDGVPPSARVAHTPDPDGDPTPPAVPELAPDPVLAMAPDHVMLPDGSPDGR